jgi:hypothetical protein
MPDASGFGQHPLDPIPDVRRLPSKVLDKLSDWRKSWSEIWWIKVAGKHYVFRSPTRGEALEHDHNLASSPGQAQDRLVSDCLLHPESLPDDMPAQEWFQIYKAVWIASGWKDVGTFVRRMIEAEDLVYSDEHQHILLLLKAFQGLLPDVINSWQPEKLAYHIALAKALTGQPPTPPGQRAKFMPPEEKVPQPRVRQGTFDWEKDRDAHVDFDPTLGGA